MRFEVPQFIDIKDKIIGPLTLPQFFYIAGGAGISYVLIKILPGILGIIVALPFAILAVALAFYKLNGRPFIVIIQAFFQYLLRGKMYLWERRKQKPVHFRAPEKVTLSEAPPKQLTETRIRDLAKGLDILK